MADETSPYENRQLRIRSIIDILPASWRAQTGKAFVSAYRIVGVSMSELSPAFAVELGPDICVLMGWLQLPHLRIESEIDPALDGQFRINVRGGTGELRPNWPSVLFLVPCNQSENGSLEDAQRRIHETVGLLSAVESLSLVFQHIEDYWLSLPDGRFSAASTQIINLVWLFDANVNDQARGRWRQAADAIANHPASEQIRLALCWFDEGKRSQGVDSFLKLWFALETLAMPNTTEIRPIKEHLAATYSCPISDVEPRFGIGRIFGLRGRIVHDGLRLRIPEALLSLVAGIFLDVLCRLLDTPSSKRAEHALDEAGGLDSILPHIVKSRPISGKRSHGT